MLVHLFQSTEPEMLRLGNPILKNSSVRMLHLAEKISVVEILLIEVQLIVAIRHVNEHLAGTGALLRHSLSYQGVTTL